VAVIEGGVAGAGQMLGNYAQEKLFPDYPGNKTILQNLDSKIARAEAEVDRLRNLRNKLMTDVNWLLTMKIDEIRQIMM
jgi:hypothetical protein